jgi:hypothetical protein
MVVDLGLDPDIFNVTSIETIAGALRRTASFHCPCNAATLIRSVVRPLRGLVKDPNSVRSLAEETLEAMIAHGDILDHSDIVAERSDEAKSLLYAAHPSFVARRSGTVILVGIASDRLPVFPEEFEKRIEHINHIRRMKPLPHEDLPSELVHFGLNKLSYENWLNTPTSETPAQLLSRHDRLLDRTPPSHEIPGLSLLEPELPVRYYRGRWVEPRSQTGRFVGRRSQAYGADLWCYVKMHNGHPERLLDFPIESSRWRGCDEAWRLQMAIDALRAKPQQFRTCPEPGETLKIQFFSPLPMWARKRLDAVGEPASPSGCLFAYKLAASESEEELRFAREVLWLGEHQ